MSHTTAAATVLWAVFFGQTTTVISVGEREASEVVQMAFKHAKVLQALGSKWAQCRLKGDGIVFENGGRILALPASSGGRGFSGNVFLDEYAYLEKPQAVWDSASAVALHGYRIRVSSTPNGVGNNFHKLWTDPKENKGWVKHKVSLADAQAAGMKVRMDRCWSMAKGDPRLFSQLFECSFLDGSEQYIPTKLVMDAKTDDTNVFYGESYAGYDVGDEKDLSVLVHLKQVADGSVWVQSPIWTGKRTDWQKEKENIFESVYNNDIKKICMDQTGMGSGLVKEMQQRIGHRVEGVKFSLQLKEELATDLYQAFAAGMVHIPNDPDLIKDILSIRRIITESGNVKYDAPSTVDGHADRFWALALAIHACTNKPGKRIMKGPGDFGNV